MKKILLSIVTCLIFIGGITIPEAIAKKGVHPEITVDVVFNKSTYFLNIDPIKVTITLRNEGDDIVTSKGFKDQPFYLFLTFTNPHEKGIAAKHLLNTLHEEPPPPKVIKIEGELIQVEEVEIIESDWKELLRFPISLIIIH